MVRQDSILKKERGQRYLRKKERYFHTSWYNHKSPLISCSKLFSEKSSEIVIPSPDTARINFEVKSYSFSILKELYLLKDAIVESEDLLDLEDNWDDEGGRRISNRTWLDAIGFLISYSEYILENFESLIISPSISPCSDGSIDLTWTTDSARMLINFRSSEDRAIYFYGDNYNDNSQIKGSFTPDNFKEYIACWLKNVSKMKKSYV